MRLFRKFFGFRESKLLIIVAAYLAILSIYQPAKFLNPINIFGILYSISINGIILGAMTVLFVSGGFDMSVGSTLGFCGVLVAIFLKNGIPALVAIIITLLVGIAFGSIMGYIISYLGINPFIVTLAGWFMIGAFIFILSGGGQVTAVPKSFNLLSSYKIFHVPFVIIFFILLIIVFDFLLRKNLLFRQNFFIGGNEKAAILAGIKVKRIKLFNYALVAGMAALAGIFNTARFYSAYPTAGEESAFTIITAVIIGGASLEGGSGTVIGSFLGLIFMSLINDSLVLWEINVYWNKIFIGLIIVIAVIIDINTKRKGIDSINQ